MRKKYERLAELWEEKTPVFVIPGVSLAKLKARPKPCKNDREEAAAKMGSMRDWPSDPFSGIFQDSEGHRLAAIIATRVPAGESADSPLVDVGEEDWGSPLTEVSELSDSPLSEEETESVWVDSDDDDYDDNARENNDLGAEDSEEEDSEPDEDMPGDEEEYLELAKVPLPESKTTVRPFLLSV